MTSATTSAIALARASDMPGMVSRATRRRKASSTRVLPPISTMRLPADPDVVEVAALVEAPRRQRFPLAKLHERKLVGPLAKHEEREARIVGGPDGFGGQRVAWKRDRHERARRDVPEGHAGLDLVRLRLQRRARVTHENGSALRRDMDPRLVGCELPVDVHLARGQRQKSGLAAPVGRIFQKT